MDSNSRCPITPPQHDWWQLHINVSTVPTRTNTCLQCYSFIYNFGKGLFFQRKVKYDVIINKTIFWGQLLRPKTIHRIWAKEFSYKSPK